jgi:amino acid adenylation domain-containing protein
MTLADDRRRLLAQRIRGSAYTKPESNGVGSSRQEPASYGQRRLWFLEQLQQIEAPYTLHAVKRIEYPLDPATLADGLSRIVARHEALRTTFKMIDQDLVQTIAADVVVEPRVVDLAGVAEDRREQAALSRMSEALAERFDLARGPLIRVWLYSLAPAHWLMLVAVHHIVFDGPSFDVFFRELTAIYGALSSGMPPSLPHPEAQYADFAREQRSRLTPDRIEAETAFWRGELEALPLLDLPTDRPRGIHSTFRGALHRISVPPDLVRRLQALASASRSTIFTVLLAGYWAMISRLCRQTDFGIGLPVTGRDSLARQNAIGFFVDTVVTRLRAEADPTADALLAAARDALRRSLAHKMLPFDMIVQRLGPERDLGVNPFFQVGFQFMEYFTNEGTADLVVPRSSAMFDLGLDLWGEGEGFAGRFEYNSDLFDSATASMMEHAFVASLNWLLEGNRQLSELQLAQGLAAAEHAIIKGPEVALEFLSCVDLFETAAAQHKDAVALVGSDRSFTYAETLAETRRLASALAQRGVGPGATVVLKLDRSLDLTLLQLAVLRLAASFACFDPAWPAERRARACSDLKPTLVIDKRLLAELRGSAPTTMLPRYPTGTDRAYVIFTSGSTGTPKGVEIEHRGLYNIALAQKLTFGLGPGRRVIQLSSPTFDASIFEMILALTSGATLVIAPCGVLAGDALENFLQREAIDTIVAPPSILATLPLGTGQSLRLICAAGESCPADLAPRFAANAMFYNLYGPTEATIWATLGQRLDGARVAIGRPIANTTTFVMDDAMQVLPVGIVGELCVASPGLARGYLGQPRLTAERFRDDVPLADARIYRTGDLVRQTRSGDLVFIGRADRQVKVRGLRIELEEVEVALRAEPTVVDVVADTAEIGGQTAIIAYLQCQQDAKDTVVDACRRRLSGRLPAFMMPSRFVLVEEFCRSPSGKIDRNALPPPTSHDTNDARYFPPATPTEEAVARIMAHVLQLPRVGAEDDFFHIGGHSLAAVNLAARATAAFGVELTILAIFSHSTVRALASYIESLNHKDGDGPGLPTVDEVPLVRLPRGQPGLQT